MAAKAESVHLMYLEGRVQDTPITAPSYISKAAILMTIKNEMVCVLAILSMASYSFAKFCLPAKLRQNYIVYPLLLSIQHSLYTTMTKDVENSHVNVQSPACLTQLTSPNQILIGFKKKLCTDLTMCICICIYHV